MFGNTADQVKDGKLFGDFVQYGYDTAPVTGGTLQYTGRQAFNPIVPAAVVTELEDMATQFASGAMKIAPTEKDARGGARRRTVPCDARGRRPRSARAPRVRRLRREARSATAPTKSAQTGSGSGMTALLEMRGIVRCFGAVRANDGVDLDVAAGQILGLLGENGSGKSTLMKVLFGMIAARFRHIVFRGRPLAGHRPGRGDGGGHRDDPSALHADRGDDASWKT